MFDYHEFRRYLRDTGRILYYRIPHYMNWIDKYLKFIQDKPTEDKHVDSYLGSLSNCYPDWMVRQAQHAVGLYLLASGRVGMLDGNQSVTIEATCLEIDTKNRL